METVVEYSKSSAALCRNPQCKCSSRHIAKGSIRFKVPVLGYTHIECLPKGPNDSVKNLVGLKHLSKTDQQRVEELFIGQKEDYTLVHRPPLNADQFLPLLQRVLSSATTATEIASQQGQAAGYAVLMSHLRTICDARSTSASHVNVMGSPVPQVSLEGSTPHTASTISTLSTATSTGTHRSAQSLTQDTTPAQASSSLQADIVGSQSASTRASTVVGEHLLTSPAPPRSTVNTGSATVQSTTADSGGPQSVPTTDVDEFVVVEADKGSTMPASSEPPTPPALPSMPTILEEESPVEQTVEPCVAPLPPPPPPSPVTAQAVVQRKHARVIEAATAPPEYTREQKAVDDTQHSDSQASITHHASSDDDSSTSSTSTASSQQQHVLQKHTTVEMTTTSTSTTNHTSVGAMGLGSPAPASTSRAAHSAPALQYLSDMLSGSAEAHSGRGSGNSGASGASGNVSGVSGTMGGSADCKGGSTGGTTATTSASLAVTVPVAARSSAVSTSRAAGALTSSTSGTTSTAKPHTTKSHTATTHAKKHTSSTSSTTTSTTIPANTANTTATPQATSLRQLLRQSTEQRRRVANAVPRFNNSAASLHFSRLAQQQEQGQK